MIKTKLFVLSLSLLLVSGIITSGFIDLSKESPTVSEASKKIKPTTFTDANFKELIAEGVTMVDFWATWCGPCIKQGPIIEEIANDFNGKAVIGKLDVDKNQKIRDDYYVRTIPTIIFFKDGKVVERLVGMQSKEKLARVLKRYL